MRVDQNHLTDQAGATASRAAESQRIQVDTAISSASVGAGGDRVDLSGLTGKIAETMHALSSRSLEKVAGLQREFRAGRYQPEAGAIAGALAKQASRAGA